MKIAAVILAAGAGARLGGRNKAALRLADGRTFVETIVGAARGAGAESIVVVVGGVHAEQTREQATGNRQQATGNHQFSDVSLVENFRPERGMISSIVAGLAGLDADGALVWPVDCPFVAVETVGKIIAAGARGRIVIPTVGGHGGHPTFFGAATWPALAAAIDAPGGARAVIAAEKDKVVRLAVDDPGILRDVDTVEDLA